MYQDSSGVCAAWSPLSLGTRLHTVGSSPHRSVAATASEPGTDLKDNPSTNEGQGELYAEAGRRSFSRLAAAPGLPLQAGRERDLRTASLLRPPVRPPCFLPPRIPDRCVWM